MKNLLLALVLLLPATASAQNCASKQVTLSWFQQFAAPPDEVPYRVDYLFYPAREAYYSSGWVLEILPYTTTRSQTEGRLWYLSYRGWFDYELIPTQNLFCRCNLDSCVIR